jgi:acetyl/propionyl-CoA carboxylase alpha subunit
MGRDWTARGVAALTVWLEIAGKKVKVEVPSPAYGGGVAEFLVDGRALAADVKVLQPDVMSLVVAGRQYRCVLDGDAVVVNGRRYEFTVFDPRSLQGRLGSGAGMDGPRSVKAPMPGRVVRLLVAAGDEVAEQQGLVVIEAMKMQNELKSPKAGRVIRVGVGVGDAVANGDVLAVVE